jgi:hypothetical protein
MGLAIVAAAALGLQGCAQEKPGALEKPGPLEGAWELVDAKYTPADPGFSLASQRQIKILTKTHWAFLSQDRSPPQPATGSNAGQPAAAPAFTAGGGTYTLDGDTYTEHIEFFFARKFVGATITYKIRWEGDEWIQTGTLPLKALGASDQDVELQERYRRIK